MRPRFTQAPVCPSLRARTLSQCFHGELLFNILISNIAIYFRTFSNQYSGIRKFYFCRFDSGKLLFCICLASVLVYLLFTSQNVISQLVRFYYYHISIAEGLCIATQLLIFVDIDNCYIFSLFFSTIYIFEFISFRIHYLIQFLFLTLIVCRL